MTQKQILYFNAVCSSGSVTKAAEELFVSRPVISRALHELEEEIGAVLFLRTNSGLILTEQGNALHMLFKEFTRSYDVTLERVHHLNSYRASRVLRVGITPTNGKRFYPDFYRSLHAAYGDIRLQVTEVPAKETMALVLNNEADICFTPTEIDTASFLGYTKLYDSHFVFCAADSGPYAGVQSVVLTDIENLPMAALNSPMPRSFHFNNVVLNTSQQDLVRMAVACGDAHAVLPLEMVEDWDGVAAIPLEPCTKYSVKLIWNKAVPHNSAFDDFMTFVNNYDLSKLERTEQSL